MSSISIFQSPIADLAMRSSPAPGGTRLRRVVSGVPPEPELGSAAAMLHVTRSPSPRPSPAGRGGTVGSRVSGRRAVPVHCLRVRLTVGSTDDAYHISSVTRSTSLSPRERAGVRENACPISEDVGIERVGHRPQARSVKCSRIGTGKCSGPARRTFNQLRDRLGLESTKPPSRPAVMRNVSPGASARSSRNGLGIEIVPRLVMVVTTAALNHSSAFVSTRELAITDRQSATVRDSAFRIHQSP